MEIKTNQAINHLPLTIIPAKNKKVATESWQSTLAVNKIELNKNILQMTLALSLLSCDKLMIFLLENTHISINDVGDSAIQNVVDAGVDESPEATAHRLISLMTVFFSKYQEIHSLINTEDQLSLFVSPQRNNSVFLSNDDTKITTILGSYVMEIKTDQAINHLPLTMIPAKIEKVSAEPLQSILAVNKIELNKNILQTSLELSLTAGDKPMTLLLKTALDGINKALKNDFGDNAIQNAYDAGIDVSPEATAHRIVSLTTAFFPKYQATHPELSAEEALKSFVNVIGKGIDQGFNEAKSILKGLNVLDSTMTHTIDLTYEWVQKGLQNFIAQYNSEENTAEVVPRSEHEREQIAELANEYNADQPEMDKKKV